ncbi:MAG: hypothetical protein H8E98_01265 [Bacteroidetes bacterium]|nr:hypothetical protein [Bacteroidota bacterium]
MLVTNSSTAKQEEKQEERGSCETLVKNKQTTGKHPIVWNVKKDLVQVNISLKSQLMEKLLRPRKRFVFDFFLSFTNSCLGKQDKKNSVLN